MWVKGMINHDGQPARPQRRAKKRRARRALEHALLFDEDVIIARQDNCGGVRYAIMGFGVANEGGRLQ